MSNLNHQLFLKFAKERDEAIKKNNFNNRFHGMSDFELQDIASKMSNNRNSRLIHKQIYSFIKKFNDSKKTTEQQTAFIQSIQDYGFGIDHIDSPEYNAQTFIEAEQVFMNIDNKLIKKKPFELHIEPQLQAELVKQARKIKKGHSKTTLLGVLKTNNLTFKDFTDFMQYYYNNVPKDKRWA